MADELQALLDRIHNEGVKKADSEREQLLAEARQKASRLLEEAKAEAKELTEAAKAEAAQTLEKGKQALQQAARDTILSLREQLQKRMATVAASFARESLAPTVMSEIVLDMAKAYIASGNEAPTLKVLLNAEQLAKVEGELLRRLGEELKVSGELKPVPEISGGFRISFEGSDLNYDFSDEALAEILCQFLNPKLAEMVSGA